MEIDLPQAFKARNGFTRFPNILFEKDLSSSEMHVLLAICYHLPKAFPSLERISKITGISRRQVIRITKNLELKGILWIEKNYGTSSTYSVLSKKKK